MFFPFYTYRNTFNPAEPQDIQQDYPLLEYVLQEIAINIKEMYLFTLPDRNYWGTGPGELSFAPLANNKSSTGQFL